MPTDGAAVPSIAGILVVFFAFGVATIVLLWLMDMLVDALRWRIIEYPRAGQGTSTEPEGALRPAPSDAPEGDVPEDNVPEDNVPEGARRPWWRRLFER